jgi:hypothetical protein
MPWLSNGVKQDRTRSGYKEMSKELDQIDNRTLLMLVFNIFLFPLNILYGRCPSISRANL